MGIKTETPKNEKRIKETRFMNKSHSPIPATMKPTWYLNSNARPHITPETMRTQVGIFNKFLPGSFFWKVDAKTIEVNAR